MRAGFLAVLGFLVLLSQGATAAPRTPSAQVNGAEHLAQVGQMGRIRLTYDVRALGAAGVRVLVHRWPLRRPDAPPDREWRFWTAVGPQDVRFDHLPVGVYRVVTVALDLQGNEIARQSYPVFVEYGGRRAWDGMQQDVDLRAEPPPFAGVGVTYVPAEDQPRVELSPATSVVKPGQEVHLRAVVRNMAPGTQVEWELDGPGDLETQPDGQAKYKAPNEDSNQIARIRCYVPGTAATEGGATVLVTPIEVER